MGEGFEENKKIIVTTFDTVEGFENAIPLGIIWATVIKPKHILKDMRAVAKTITGGDISEYEEITNKAIKKAMEKLVDKAKEVGADAVLDISFKLVPHSNAIEVVVYGTAVKKREKK